MLGINAVIGRTFTEDEQTLGKQRGVLLSVGIPMAVAASYALRGVLSGVDPQNPAIVAITAGTVTFVGLLAGLLPSGRACRINPVEMLRAE